MVDFGDSIEEGLIFILAGGGLVFTQLTLDLESGDDQVDGVEQGIGDDGPGGSGDAVAEGFEEGSVGL